MPAERKAGCLYLVATPIGNLGDITRRAVEILGEVDLILAEDTRRTRALLTHLGIAGALRAYHEHNETRSTPRALGELREGAQVALVSDAGTPAVCDPGFRLVREAIDHGIRVVPVPGPSAVIAALVGSGLPTDSFSFHGYPPRRRAALTRFFEALREDRGTLVLLESPRRVAVTLEVAADSLGGDRPACVARELTKVHEEFLRGTLAELASMVDATLRGEVTLCIAGRSPDGPPAMLDAATLRERYATLLAEGVAPKSALRALVETTGMNRRDVYRALHLGPDSEA